MCVSSSSSSSNSSSREGGREGGEGRVDTPCSIRHSYSLYIHTTQSHNRDRNRTMTPQSLYDREGWVLHIHTHTYIYI